MISIGRSPTARPGMTAAARALRPSLLQICLSLEPSFPAYHAAWEFTLAAHGGELAAMARACGERRCPTRKPCAN